MSGLIKRRLAEGRLVRIFSVGAIPNPKIIELVAIHGGYHGVWIDQEHAALDQQHIELLALACRASGLDSYVRLAPTDYATVMRPFESGVGGIMAAQVRSAESVRQFVAWAKYPPVGIRGLNVSNFEGRYGNVNPAELVARANQDRWIAVQIETPGALDEVDSIARVEGVDHLFVGPMDLSLVLGVPGEFLHPKCTAALERVSRAARDAGITWGILPRGPEHASFCAELGCLLFAFGQDLAFLNQGVRAVRALYESYFAEP